MRRSLRIGLKDLLVTVRDLPALAVLLGMPIVLILILGSALGSMTGGGQATRVAIVNQDRGDIGRRIVDGFGESEDLRKLFDVGERDDLSKVRSEIELGDLPGALVIPPDFSERVDAGKPVSMEVLADPGREQVGKILESVAQSIATRISAASVVARTVAEGLAYSRMVADADAVGERVKAAAQHAAEEGALDGVGVRSAETKDAEEFDALDYYSGSMSAMFLLFGAMFGAFSLVRERQDWTLPRLMSTPASRWEIVAGKMLGVFAVGVLQFAVLWAFSRMMGVDWGDPAGVALIGIGTLVSVSGLAILFSAIAKTPRAVGALAPIVIQIQAAAGGSFFPVEAFPKWLQPLQYATINGWAIQGMQDLQRGANAADMLPSFAALVAIGLALSALGVWRLRWE